MSPLAGVVETQYIVQMFSTWHMLYILLGICYILYKALQLYKPQSILHENREAAVTSRVFAECGVRRAAAVVVPGSRGKLYTHTVGSELTDVTLACTNENDVF